jgi:ankyrin repeat protein
MTTQPRTSAFILRSAATLLAASAFGLGGCDNGDTSAAKPSDTTDAVAASPPKINPNPAPSIGKVDPDTGAGATVDRGPKLPDPPKGLTTKPTTTARAPARTTPLTADLEPLDITFAPETLDLGLMQPGVPKTGIITLTNHGDKPVQIKKAIASCGCTTPNWPREAIGPGETAEIEITLKPSLKQGQKLNKRVTLQMVSGPPQILKIAGEVGLFVRVSPTFLDAGQKSEDGVDLITLDSADEIEFAIISVDPDVTTGFDTEKGLHHELTLDWDKWETLGRRPQVKIRTDHPNAPEMSMTVRRAITARTPRPPAATSQRSPLISAAQQNNVENVKAAIASGGATLDDNSSLGGMSALHWAAKNGNVEIAAALLEAGASVDITSKVGKTPLATAAESGQMGVLELLIDKGGNIESIDQIGGTPLLWAAGLSPNDETVAFLIKKGGNVNVIDTNGMTPLIWAAGIGQASVVKLLIDNGADLGVAEMHQQETAMMRAARIGKIETLGFLVDAGADLKATNALGHNSLMIASGSAPLVKVQMLVDAGSDVSAKDIRGWTAMDHALTRTDGGRDEVIAYLKTVMPTDDSASE